MRSDGTVHQVRIPRGWRSTTGPRPGILMEMSPRKTPASGLAPCVTLTVAETDLGPREHQARLCALIRRTFDRVDVEASESYDHLGTEVGYLRFFHRTPRHDVIVEMWTWLVGGRVWSLVASADHNDHPDYTELFDEIAATFDPGGAAMAS